MSLQQYKYNTTRIPANEDIKHNNKQHQLYNIKKILTNRKRTYMS